MQQKTKFIIFIGSICFISLLFFPISVHGTVIDTSSSGGGDSCCLKYDYIPQGCSIGFDTDLGSSTYGQTVAYSSTGSIINSCSWGCVDWDTASSECVSGATTTTKKPKDKWCCNNSTGTCYKCSKTGAWSTQAKCEACCPTGTYLHCRPPLTTFWGADANKLYCKLATWCEVDPGDECSPQNSVCPASTPTPTPTKYSCSSSGCVVSSSGGYTTSSCDNKCVKRCVGTSCQYNDNTSNSTCTYSSQCSITSTKYRCSSTSGCISSSSGGYTTSNCGGKCLKRCVGTSCKYSSNTSYDICSDSSQCAGTSTKYSCNETNWTCEEDPNGTTWEICEADCTKPDDDEEDECEIYKFSINDRTNEDTNPLRVWVNASLKGYFSVSYVCTSCAVTSVPSDGNENWTGAKGTYDSLPSSGNVTELFKINTAGTYSYTLECIGTDPEDIVTNTLSLQTVEALNLPWWREIIPVLQGY